MTSRTACEVLGAVLLGAVLVEPGAAQETLRVSVDSSGVEGNRDSVSNGISTDGRFVAFHSGATNLVAGDGNNCFDVFLFDRSTGTTERVSLDSAGNEMVGTSYVTLQPMSGDGSIVAFMSFAPFDPADANGFMDIYVRDRVNGTTTLASVDSSGNQGNQDCYGGTLSQDGRCVAFRSFANNLVSGDTNGQFDVFVHDLGAAATERVSVDSSGVEGDGESGGPSINADGNLVAFCSKSTNLVSADTNRRWDVFVRDRAAGITERVSVDSNGQEANGDSVDPSISADGRFVAFESTATNLVSTDGNQRTDIFVRDRATGSTTRVNVSSALKEANWDSATPSISADGRFVAFDSLASNLVSGDTNKQRDVFLHDRAKATTTRVNVDASGTEGNLGSWSGAVSTGGDVSFASVATNLVASDSNGCCDVFVHDVCDTPATWTNYGTSFPGTNGVPTLSAAQFPQLGATITVALANSYGQPTLGCLVLGLQRASLPTKWGGDLLVLPTLIVPITFSYGTDTFTGTIPDGVAYCGVAIDLQGIELDPGAQYGVSFSQGLELVIGS